MKHYNLLVFLNDLYTQLLQVEIDESKVSMSIGLMIHSELREVRMSEIYWRVVIEVQLEQAHIFPTFVVQQGEWFLSDLEHDESSEVEKYLWRSVLTCLFNLLQNVRSLNQGVL